MLKDGPIGSISDVQEQISSSEFLQFIESNEKDFISFKTEKLLADVQHDPIKRAQLITDIVYGWLDPRIRLSDL